MKTLTRKKYWILFVFIIGFSIASQAQCLGNNAGTGADCDGDGVVNEKDLDDDNDGIKDIDEGAVGLNPDGTGIPIVLSSTDTDKDSVPDYLDRNSDNDDCIDAVEGSGTFYGGAILGGSGNIASAYPNPIPGTNGWYLYGPVDPATGLVNLPTQTHTTTSRSDGGLSTFSNISPPVDATVAYGSTHTFTMGIKKFNSLNVDISNEITYNWLNGDNETAGTPIIWNQTGPAFSTLTINTLTDHVGLTSTNPNHGVLSSAMIDGNEIPYEFLYTVFCQHNFQGCIYQHNNVKLKVLRVVASQDVSICTGTTTNLLATPLGYSNLANLSYEWTPTTGLDDPFSPNPKATPTATTTYTVRITDSSNGLTTTDDVTVTLGNSVAPTVADVCVNSATGTGNLTVTSPLTSGLNTYSYRIRNQGDATWPTGYQFPATFTNLAAGTYEIECLNTTNGCQSNIATARVNPLPTAEVSGTATICNGDPAVNFTFTGTPNAVVSYNLVTPSATTLSSITLDASGTATLAASNTVTSTVNLLSASLTYSSPTITCNGPITLGPTTTATVTVNPLPTAMVSGTKTICNGDTPVNFTFTGTPDAVVSYELVTGGTTTPGTIVLDALGTATLSASNTVTSTVNLVSVSLTYSSPTITCNRVITVGATTTATVTVNDLPTATVSGTTTICSGNPAVNFTFSGTPNAVVTYELVRATTPTPTTTTSTITLNGLGTATLAASNTVTSTINLISASLTYSSPTITCSGTILAAPTTTATVTVNDLPTATVSGTTTICNGDTAVNFTFTGTPNAVVTYNLVSATTPTPTTTPGTITLDGLGIAILPASNTVTSTVNLVSASLAYLSPAITCSGPITASPTTTATVTVNPLPTATVTGTNTICSGGTAVNFTFIGTPNAVVTYELVSATTPTPTTTTGTITLNASGTATLAASNTVTSTVNLLSASLTYSSPTITCSGPITASPTTTATVTINPLPTATVSGTTTICNGDTAVNFTFTGTPNALISYNLVRATTPTPTTTLATITLDALGTATLAASNTVTSTVNLLSASLTYSSPTVTCSGPITASPTTTATVTVNPLPTATVSGTTTICNGDTAVNFTFTGTPNAVISYNLVTGSTTTPATVTLDGLGSATLPASNTATSTINLVSVSLTYSSPTITCNRVITAGPTTTATVTVNDLPTATVSGTTTICNGSTAVNFTFTGTPNAVVSYNLVTGGTTTPATITLNGLGTATLAASNTVTSTVNLVRVALAYSSPTITCSRLITLGPTTTATVTVNDLPTATVSGTTTICNGATAVNFTFTGTPNAVITYDLVSATTPTPTTTTGTITLDALGTATLPASNTVTNTVNLVSASLAYSLPTITCNRLITAAPTTTATVTISSGDRPTFNQLTYTICEGDAASPLPRQSDDSIATTGILPIPGTWIPQFDYINDGTYTFVPSIPCAAKGVTANVVIIKKPIFNIDDQATYCVNSSGGIVNPVIIDTGLDGTQYDFTWYLDEIQQPYKTSSISPNEPGTYRVEVKDKRALSIAKPICTVEDECVITSYQVPVVEAKLSTQSFETNQSIVAVGKNGSQNYEYSLNSPTGPWTTNPVFSNVPSGVNTIYIRDVLGGCDGEPDSVLVIGYPEYFTPNGDGINDIWNIEPVPDGLENYIPNSIVHIYDRFGKLVKELDPTNPNDGWDGTSNGELMPASDYWFVVEYDDFTQEASTGVRKQFKAHFSLKR